MTRATFEKSVDILLDAYNNGKLEHGIPCGCAVGNLLGSGDWWEVIGFPSLRAKTDRSLRTNFNQDRPAYNTIIERGYTPKELSQIEIAFECSVPKYMYKGITKVKSQYKNEAMYIGLVAVIECMKDMVEEEVDIETPKTRLTKIFNDNKTIAK